MTHAFDQARYCSFATFRRDGREVRTPVWFAGSNGVYVMFSAAAAGKVKRLRRDPRARVAACGARGAIKGPWHDARARLLDDPAEQRAALAALGAKYGWAMALTNLLSRIGGRLQQRAYIRIEFDE